MLTCCSVGKVFSSPVNSNGYSLRFIISVSSLVVVQLSLQDGGSTKLVQSLRHLLWIEGSMIFLIIHTNLWDLVTVTFTSATTYKTGNDLIEGNIVFISYKLAVAAHPAICRQHLQLRFLFSRNQLRNSKINVE